MSIAVTVFPDGGNDASAELKSEPGETRPECR